MKFSDLQRIYDINCAELGLDLFPEEEETYDGMIVLGAASKDVLFELSCRVFDSEMHGVPDIHVGDVSALLILGDVNAAQESNVLEKLAGHESLSNKSFYTQGSLFEHYPLKTGEPAEPDRAARTTIEVSDPKLFTSVGNTYLYRCPEFVILYQEDTADPVDAVTTSIDDMLASDSLILRFLRERETLSDIILRLKALDWPNGLYILNKESVSRWNPDFVKKLIWMLFFVIAALLTVEKVRQAIDETGGFYHSLGFGKPRTERKPRVENPVEKKVDKEPAEVPAPPKRTFMFCDTEYPEDVEKIVCKGAPPPRVSMFRKEQPDGKQTVVELHALKNFENLRELELQHVIVPDLAPMRALDKLEEFIAVNLMQHDEKGVKKNLDISPLGELVNLKSFIIMRSNVKNVSSIRNLTGLRRLDIRDNPVKNISKLKKLRKLETLLISNTQISDISVIKNFENLQDIYAPESPIEDISPIRHCIKMRELSLRKTQVKDLSPLKGLTDIEILDISSTNAEDLSPIIGMKKLKKLYIDHLKVKNLFPILKDLENLNYLSCNGVDIQDEAVWELSKKRNFVIW